MHRRAASRKPTESLHDLVKPFDEAGAAQAILADDFVDQRQFVQKARQVLEQLGEGHRSVFALRELEGASTGEVAKILGSRPNAFASADFELVRAIAVIRSLGLPNGSPKTQKMSQA